MGGPHLTSWRSQEPKVTLGEGNSALGCLWTWAAASTLQLLTGSIASQSALQIWGLSASTIMCQFSKISLHTDACTHSCLLVLFLWRTLVNIHMNFPMKQCPFLTILFLFMIVSQVLESKVQTDLLLLLLLLFSLPSSHIHQPGPSHILNIYGINTFLSIHLLMKMPNHHSCLI